MKKVYRSPALTEVDEGKNAFPAYALGVVTGYAVTRGVTKALEVDSFKAKPSFLHTKKTNNTNEL